MNGKLETIATFNDLTQAQAAHAVLKAEGIASDLRDEMTGSIDWGLMPALGGLRLQVDTADVQKALEVLKDFDAETKNPTLNTADDQDEPSDAEELAYRERSRRRKRLVVLVSFLILFLPMLVALFLGWFAEW
jgi:predicted nucleic acid-binding Zn ribbon protein